MEPGGIGPCIQIIQFQLSVAADLLIRLGLLGLLVACAESVIETINAVWNVKDFEQND